SERPFTLQQMVDFSGSQPGAEIFAQISYRSTSLEDAFQLRAVGVDQSSKHPTGYERPAGLARCQILRQVSTWQIAPGRGTAALQLRSLPPTNGRSTARAASASLR